MSTGRIVLTVVITLIVLYALYYFGRKYLLGKKIEAIFEPGPAPANGDQNVITGRCGVAEPGPNGSVKLCQSNNKYYKASCIGDAGPADENSPTRYTLPPDVAPCVWTWIEITKMEFDQLTLLNNVV